MSAVAFAVVFWLFKVPLEPITYGILISILIFIGFGAFKFAAYYKRSKTLELLLNNIEVTAEMLPLPDSYIEEKYNELISNILKTKNEAENINAQKYSDLIDYYSLWAHQIKTPIAAMNLLLQSSDNELSDELSEQLFKIEEYVEMVMQYLRCDGISSDLELSYYNLGAIVNDAVKKYRKQFLRRKISVEVEQMNIEVLTDKKWLSFVVEQLISNSLKYTSQGKISIYMDKKDKKTLVIEDTGIGIRSEDLPRIFERGFTGYNGREDKKSTGIGLYLCKKILRRLSHEIVVESEIDKGTIVKINMNEVPLSVE